MNDADASVLYIDGVEVVRGASANRTSLGKFYTLQGHWYDFDLQAHVTYGGALASLTPPVGALDECVPEGLQTPVSTSAPPPVWMLGPCAMNGLETA